MWATNLHEMSPRQQARIESRLVSACYEMETIARELTEFPHLGELAKDVNEAVESVRLVKNAFTVQVETARETSKRTPLT